MINILLEGYTIDAPWLYDELKNHIKPHHRVAIVAFSFRDRTASNLEEWNAVYGKNGRFYDSIVNPLLFYGIKEENITFINYFADTKKSAGAKVDSADIIYFLGGLPDKMYERIKEFELQDALMRHDKIVMGYSAGAVIQLREYHLSPDKDYPEFSYFEGLPYLDDFYLEVHYTGEAEQDRSIERVLKERGKTVYATILHEGAILVENGKIKLLGKVNTYNK